MTNPRMTNEGRMTNDDALTAAPLRAVGGGLPSAFGIRHSFDIRHSTLGVHWRGRRLIGGPPASRPAATATGPHSRGRLCHKAAGNLSTAYLNFGTKHAVGTAIGVLLN